MLRKKRVSPRNEATTPEGNPRFDRRGIPNVAPVSDSSRASLPSLSPPCNNLQLLECVKAIAMDLPGLSLRAFPSFVSRANESAASGTQPSRAIR